MYTYEENGEEVKAMTNAELYNLTDDVSKLSRVYSVGCGDDFRKHARKASIGFLVTLGTSLVGMIYTLCHSFSSGYYLGARDVYRKYSNLVEDIDDLESEYYNMDPEVRKNLERYKE